MNAVALVKKYYAVDDAIASNNKVPLDRYYEVAGGDYVLNLIKIARSRRVFGYKVVGHARATLVKAHQTSLKSKNATVKVTACLDVRNVDVVNKKGKSVVVKGRPDFFIESLTVTNKKYPTSAAWLVTNDRNKGVKRCGK